MMALNTRSLIQIKPVRILMIKLRHHGDMLLTSPVISALKQRYPQASVDVVLYEETRAILARNPEIHQIYSIDRRWKKQGTGYQLRQEWRLLRRLRQQHYDLVVNLADQWRSAMITRFTGAAVRIGFTFPKRTHPLWKMCYTHLVSTQTHASEHIVLQNLAALLPLGIQANDTPVTMHYAPEDWDYCQRLLNSDVVGNYVVIQPTSRWFFKCWQEEKMSEVIDALAELNIAVVLTSGPDAREREMIDKIISGCSAPIITSLAGQLTLTQLAALIDHARLFIGVDSVPMHMAAALKTPLIALFGPTKLQLWHPWQAKGEVIWAGDYGPLPDPDEINTNTDERYLDMIPADAVIEAAKRLLT